MSNKKNGNGKKKDLEKLDINMFFPEPKVKWKYREVNGRLRRILEKLEKDHGKFFRVFEIEGREGGYILVNEEEIELVRKELDISGIENEIVEIEEAKYIRISI